MNKFCPIFARLLFLTVALACLPTHTLAGTEPAGPMVNGRQAFAAVPLADGRVLMAGGFGQVGLMYKAEIFDPATNLFSATGSLITPRGSPAGARLPDGRVLIMGGAGPGDATSATLPLASAEIFDPVTGTWTVTSPMSFARRAPRALSLPDGRILVIGGDARVLVCEIYDPATGTFSMTGSLTAGRADFAATVLQDGRVFVAGGSSSAAGVHHASAEVWDPATGTWTAVGSMAQSRIGVAATTLPNGGVLVSGGQTGISTGIFVSVAELFDPVTGTFSATGSLNHARSEHVAARLGDGRVLIAGGSSSSGYQSAIEIYDPVVGTWSVAGALTETRRRHAGVILGDGALLVAGGFNGSSSHLASSEIIDPKCMANTPTLSAVNASFGYAAGTGSVSVSHLAGCSWRATGGNSWLTVTAGAQGWGNGDVTFSVSENIGPARSATLSIAGSAFTVSQSAHPCTTATISPSSAALGPAGGTFGISVNIPAGCAWTAMGAPSWMTVPPSGTGSQALSATVAANSGAARSATFTIAGRSFYVSQSAGPCVPAPTISPTGRSIAAAGGNSTVSITAPAACPWTVTNVPSWITMFTSGTGSTTLSFTVAANPPGAARSAFLNVAGTTFTVTQAENLCGGATLTPSSVALPNTSTTGTIALTAPANCVWAINGTPSWANFTSGYSGTGSKTLSYQVGGNSGPAQSATMTIAGATLTMSRPAGNCWPSSTISPTSSPTFSATGGNATVTVNAQSSCTWTVTSLPSWVTVTSAVPVTGSGSVTFSVAPNTGAARSYTMVIAGSTYSVTQSAGPCAGSSVSPVSSPTFATTGGSGTVTVTAQAGCTWTVSNLPAWITVTSPLPVTGSGSVSYSVASNTGGARNAALTIAGATHSVAQSGAAAYCAARGSTSNYEWIQQVAFAGQTRNTGNNGGYADFTTGSAISLARGSNAITVTPGFSSGSYSEYWRVWIDFNSDMTFSDSELVFSGTSSSAIASSFTVPSTAPAGTTRMRVSMKYGSAATACGSFSYGEVEDYTAIIP